MRWFSLGMFEVGIARRRLVIGTAGRVSRILIDWTL